MAPTAFTTTLRIDPDKGLFCQDKCRKPEPIAGMDGQTLRLRSALLSPEMEGFGDAFVVDPGAGRMQRFTYYPTPTPHGLDHEFHLDKYVGDCKRTKFTGLKG